jgi:hypothetical protein
MPNDPRQPACVEVTSVNLGEIRSVAAGGFALASRMDLLALWG